MWQHDHRDRLLTRVIRCRMATGLGMTPEEWAELRTKVDDSFWVMRAIGAFYMLLISTVPDICCSGYPPLPGDHDGISCGAHRCHHPTYYCSSRQLTTVNIGKRLWVFNVNMLMSTLAIALVDMLHQVPVRGPDAGSASSLLGAARVPCGEEGWFQVGPRTRSRGGRPMDQRRPHPGLCGLQHR